MSAPSCRRVVGIAALAVLAGLAGDVLHLRSFEFLPGSLRDGRPIPLLGAIPQFVPPAPPAAPAVPPVDPAVSGDGGSAAAPSQGVTLVFVDGMRLDVSRRLPTYSQLRAIGADVETRCLFPTFTRVGQATISSGAGPRTHGYMVNFNHRAAAVQSIGDLARAAGVHTRYVSNVGKPVPFMFPNAVRDEDLGPLDAAALADGPRPHLTLVYLREPDLQGHEHGGASPEYLAAAQTSDAEVARIASALDLTRETLIVATDHGHRDRGGHGGTEEVGQRIPLVLAGAGIRPGVVLGPEAESDLRDIAPTAAVLLGLPPLAHATGRPLYEVLRDPPATRVERGPLHPDSDLSLAAGIGRALLGALLFGLPPLLLLRGASSRGGWAGAALGLGGLYALYAVQGYPFSFSCVNSEPELPGFMLQVQAMAVLSAAGGALLAGSGARFAAGAIPLTAAFAGACWLGCGLGAPVAFAWPWTAFQAHLGFTALIAAGLVSLGAVFVLRVPRAGREEGEEEEG